MINVLRSEKCEQLQLRNAFTKTDIVKDMVIGMLCIIKIVGHNLRKPINPQVIAHQFYNTLQGVPKKSTPNF